MFLDGFPCVYIPNDRKFSVDFKYGFIQILEGNMFLKKLQKVKKNREKMDIFRRFWQLLEKLSLPMPKKSTRQGLHAFYATHGVRSTQIRRFLLPYGG